MIPKAMGFSVNDEAIQTSLTYKVDLEKKHIVGKVDGIDAIVQAVIKNFYTERYAYVIYSQNYGIEIEQYIAQDFDFIKTDIEQTIRECLVIDDRIQSLEDFKCELGKDLDAMLITFRLQTVEGVLDFEREVKIA